MIRRTFALSLAAGFLFTIANGCTPNPRLALRSSNDPALPPGPVGIRLTVGSSASQSATPPAASKDESPAKPAASAATGEATKDQGTPSNVVVIHADAKNVAAVEKALKPEKKFAADLSALKRVLVFTITKGAYRPADRIVRLRIRVSPENFAFSDYAASATSYSTVSIDKLDLAQDNSITGTINPTFATGMTGFGSVAATADRKLDETSEILLHPLDLNVNLDGPDLVIDREAERGQELAGNILVKITLRPSLALPAERDKEQIHYDLVVTGIKLIDDKTGIELPPDKASISTALLRHFVPEDLKAKVTLEYVARHVVSGQNTYAEYRQDVDFEAPAPCTREHVVVVSASDLYVPLWEINAVGRGVIAIQDAGTYRPLNFQDPVDATNVTNWMTSKKARVIGKRHLKFEISGVYPELRVIPATALAARPQAGGGFQCPPS